MTRTATCCCKACSLEVEGEPAINAICHCNNCKRRTGSAFGWSTYFRDEQVVKHGGTFQVYEFKTETAQQRWFCTKCGSTLFWKNSYFSGHMGIAGGCFADGDMPVPDLTVANESRCAWVGVPDSWRTEL